MRLAQPQCFFAEPTRLDQGKLKEASYETRLMLNLATEIDSRCRSGRAVGDMRQVGELSAT